MRKSTGPSTRVIRVGDLTFDEGFNRELDGAWVRKLLVDLDSRAIGAIIVSQRPDGSIVVVDGQHRVRAILEKWGPNATVTCVVHAGLTRAEEADLFYRLNQRRGLKAFDSFRARVIARHPDAMEIVSILEVRGLTYAKGPTNKAVGAISSMQKAHAQGTLGGALTLLGDAWGYEKTSWEGVLIEGAALFLARYPSADCDALRHKLAKYRGSASGFLGRADQWRDLHGTTKPRAVAALMVETYNLRRGDGSQLPPWS